MTIKSDIVYLHRLISCCGLAFLLGCADNTIETNEQAVGKWDIEWVLNEETMDTGDRYLTDVLKGTVDLKANGEATLTAYGNTRCLFLQQKEISHLRWTLSEQSLSLYKASTGFELPYQLMMAGPRHLRGSFEGIEVNMHKRR